MIREDAGIKGLLVILLTTILVTDTAIMLDIPFYRQILGFVCFAVVPGFLVLVVLKLKVVGFTKCFLLSVGLSISILLLSGLALSLLLPTLGYSEPLSRVPLVVFLSIILLALCFFAYQRNKNDYSFPSIAGFLSPKQTAPLFPTIFPLLLPMMSVVGTQYMNTNSNNTILVALFVIVPLYLVLITLFHNSISKSTFPVAIYMISLTLLLARGLTSSYLLGGDVYSEYHSYHQTLQGLQWPGTEPHSMITDALGVSLFPVVLESILGVGSLIIFKVVLIVFISAIPVVCYLICEKYLGTLRAFLASCLIMAQIPFVSLLTGQIRVGVALIFFSLAILVLVDDSLERPKKKIVFMMFGVSMVLSYYVTPVLFLVLLAFVFGVQNRWGDSSGAYRISSKILAFLTVLTFVWWGRASTSGAFESYASGLQNILSGLANFFMLESRSSTVQQLSVLGAQGAAGRFVAVVNDVSFFLILVGAVSTITMRKWKERVGHRYATLMFASLLLLVAWIILPAVSVDYGADRIYLQLLVVLAASFVIGCETLFSRRRNFGVVAATFVIVSLFVCNTALLNHFVGPPASEIFDENCSGRDLVYVYSAEVVSADWIGLNGGPNATIFLGSMTQSRGLFEFSAYWENNTPKVYSFSNLSDGNSATYVFLRYVNIVRGYGYSLDERGFVTPFELSDYAAILDSKGIIYDNGYSKICSPG
jgi:uncharacterized membrane protein